MLSKEENAALYPIDIQEAQNMSRDALWMRIRGWLAGVVYPNVGDPEIDATGIPYLDAQGARWHSIRGDGSCWSRALWQTIFSQIFFNQEQFDAFIHQIAHPKAGYDIPNALAKETIHILYKLKEMQASERTNYLNRPDVDDSLVFFMRHVAFEYARVNEQHGGYSQDQLNQIPTNKNQYGGPEINWFARYFQIEVHSLYKSQDKNEWCYAFTNTEGQTKRTSLSNLEKDKITIPHTCMVGLERHFESISFNHQLYEKDAIRAVTKDAAIIATTILGATGTGAAIGALIGTFAMPGLGTIAGTVIGATFGTVLGVAFTGFQGLIRNRLIGGFHRFGENVASGLLASLSSSGIGALVGTAILPGIGSAIGAAIGLLVGVMLSVIPGLIRWALSPPAPAKIRTDVEEYIESPSLSEQKNPYVNSQVNTSAMQVENPSSEPLVEPQTNTINTPIKHESDNPNNNRLSI